MNEQHPTITPPPELRRLWAQEAQRISPHDPVEWMQYVSEKAAQWGADTELTKCCAWVAEESSIAATELRAARRPKPLSLKKQALMALEDGDTGPGASLTPTEVSIIRRALEALPDD